jgi:trehalose/maltose transport system substrate-binding protein
MRPSQVSGSKYDQVSTAYFRAVHSVLVKQKTAGQAAADLEKELAQILGVTRGGSATSPSEVDH